MRSRGICLLLAALWLAPSKTEAVVTRFEPGRFGELTAWALCTGPATPLDKDPFEVAGGEATFTAMADPKLIPVCGDPFELPSAAAGKPFKLGGTWVFKLMTPPEFPGIFNEYQRLEVAADCRFGYCQIESPADLKASLITGITGGGSYSLCLNGKPLGVFKGGHGFETARELQVELRKGANHLFARFSDGTRLACRLVGECAEPLRDVRMVVQSREPLKLEPPAPPAVPEAQRLSTLATKIPSVPPSATRPELLGLKLARTMSLLESGKYTNRPIRIVFDGQSIEAGWTSLFIQSLRERYPDTKIIAENRAIGGWFVWRMQKLLKHDILRFQPDLVLFSAYQGTAEVWERFIGELRAETTADIVIRTQHLGGWEKLDDPEEDAETIGLRHLAMKYDVELIEVRKEWRSYLKTNEMQIKDLLGDNIHLNQKGDTLMALLYDRHFIASQAGSPWAAKVRRFDVGRFMEDNKTDGIVFEGSGWKRAGRFASSVSDKDRLRLRFHGTRVDLVMPSNHGRARVLIDGKKPSELNLFHGTRPQGATLADTGANVPMTYHTGSDMREESWVLTVTDGNVDANKDKAHQRVRFSLKGSKTGPDGEGTSDEKFVSKSGRITILPSDWMTEPEPSKPGTPAPEMRALERPVRVVWHILPDGVDTVPRGPGWLKDQNYYFGQQYDYVTVADGLPCGVHELTLVPLEEPNPNQIFTIMGIDVHRPPLAVDAAEWTVAPAAGN